MHVHSDEEKHARLKAMELGLAILIRDEHILGVRPSGHEIELGVISTQNTWRDVQKALERFENGHQTTDPKHQNHENLVAFTDGGSRGNPGPSASGYVILTADEEVLEEGGEYLGITTNNQAEYQAVKLALESAQKYHPKELHFYLDSLLVVNQLNGIFKIKNRDLWPIHEAIKELCKRFPKVTFTHVRREYNKLADAKVNEVLDTHAETPNPFK